MMIIIMITMINRHPPAYFGRVSMRWVYLIVLLGALSTALGVLSRHWV